VSKAANHVKKQKEVSKKDMVVFIYDMFEEFKKCSPEFRKEFEDSILKELKEQGLEVDENVIRCRKYLNPFIKEPVFKTPISNENVVKTPQMLAKEVDQQSSWEPNVKAVIVSELRSQTFETFSEVKLKIKVASLHGNLPPRSEEALLQYIANSCLSDIPRSGPVMEWAIHTFAPHVLEKMIQNKDVIIRNLFQMFYFKQEEQPKPAKQVTKELLKLVFTSAKNWVNAAVTNTIPTREDRMEQFIANSCLRCYDPATAHAVCQHIRQTPELYELWISL